MSAMTSASRAVFFSNSNEAKKVDAEGEEEEDLEEGEDPSCSLSRAERKRRRKEWNRQWKLSLRRLSAGEELDLNPRHSEYYKAQVPALRDEKQWRAFQTALATPLPVTFRIGGVCSSVVESSIRKRMKNEFNKCRGHFIEVNGVVLKEDIVTTVPWAGKGVWKVAADSTTLSKNPGFQVLSDFLQREVKLGNLVRQECASMIPALLLDVRSDHTVLDVCAAPGSKTEQLLHLMQPRRDAKSSLSQGMVVANDADPARIQTLMQRFSKCMTPNLLVTCATAEELSSTVPHRTFDRILADVPCSGDGTIRKFPHIWRLFRPRMSIELHSVQLSVASSCLKLLKPGGRMVYSTCSMNPLENEAVVSQLLMTHHGLRLVDTRAEGLLPELKSRPGLSNWRSDPDVFVLGESDAAKKDSLARLPSLPDLSPPEEDLHLDRCLRIYPQDNDTGGFFVAVLELSSEASTCKKTTMGFNRPHGGEKRRRTNDSSPAAVMRELGYNPKRKDPRRPSGGPTSSSARGGPTSSSAPSAPPAYTRMTSEEVANFCRKTQLTFGSDSSFALYASQEVVSLVSSGVQRALDGWAQQGGVLVSAGVSIASSGLLDCGLPALPPWIQPSRVARLCPSDFAALAHLGSMLKERSVSLFQDHNGSNNDSVKYSGLFGSIVSDQDGSSTHVWKEGTLHMTDKGRNLINALLSIIIPLLRDGDSSKEYMFLLLDYDSETAESPISCQKNGDRPKRRMSKSERKRSKGIISKPVKSSDRSGMEVEQALKVTNRAEAMVVLKAFESHGDIFVVFVTGEDKCHSYLEALEGIR